MAGDGAGGGTLPEPAGAVFLTPRSGTLTNAVPATKNGPA
jgi:hypothetical protein